ncbi:MAG: cytochrome D1 domain-containing protein, partial [Opitutaceae bacterium]|nr:cytochrome D1 domain-containing protein [Opitutaceae bacterium]
VVRVTPMPASPLGLTLSSDGASLYVTCAAPTSTVCIVNTATGKIAATIPTGHTAMAPVLSPDGRTLYVCNRFDDAVAIIDLGRRREVARVKVAREPIAAALTPDGRSLLVAHHLHHGRADAEFVAASVSVIDTARARVAKEIQLPNGSGLLRDVAISPDGKFACVTHQLSRFQLPTTQLDRGWINTNAFSVIDIARGELLNTVLLDNVSRGAANPWAAAWSADGRTICVTHAGTHELSIIDAGALLAKLLALPSTAEAAAALGDSGGGRSAADVPNDLTFLVGLRRRINVEGIGPRAVAFAGSKVYVANYFSDSLSVIDLAIPARAATAIPLGPKSEMSVVRTGEMLWNDASICFQGWQSCSSCHSSDARVDGLNWDNLNDGIANPKNAKSLLFAHRTPPAMWTGVREDAPMAVRAGIKHILFTVRPPEDAVALDRYLESLQPIPSPRLVKGKLSAAAQRGQKLFASDATACARCHTGALFTDLKLYDVGTAAVFDLPAEEFDTPTLVELWRSAPYLHDGSAATVRDVLTTRNRWNRHGVTRQLNAPQLDDLAEYLLSL